MNRLNNPIKKKRLSDRIRKNKSQTYAVYKRYTLHKKVEVAILISDKIDFKTEKMSREIKEDILQ